MGTSHVSGNLAVAGTLSVAGATTQSGAFDVAGNFSVATNKLTVAAASGNTVVAGSLQATGAITGGSVNGPVNTESLQVSAVNGSAITVIRKGTVTIDPASVNATTVADQTFTLTGAAVNDILVLNPRAALTAGLTWGGAHVSATNTVKIRFYNTTGAPIDEASATWDYILIR